MKRQNLLILVSFILLVFSECSFALPPLGGYLPGAAQSAPVSNALQNQAPQPQQRKPRHTVAPASSHPEIPESAKKIKFKLNGVVLTGNHVYSTAELSIFYKDKLHKTISVADVIIVLENITNFYRNNGYILTRAILPEQSVPNGIVRLQIIEGYIGKVSVTGTPHGAAHQVTLFGNKIMENRPLQVQVMEKYLLLANQIPHTEVKAVLEASHEKKPALGSSDLSLVTVNQPVAGYISYDNYGTRYLGPQQMTGNLSLNSFAKSGDQGQLTFIKTPKGKELTYLDANYNLPTGASGSYLQIGGTRTETNPLFVLAPLKISGLSVNYYTMATFPLIRTRTKSLDWRAGFNYLDSPTTTINNTTLYVDHLRSVDIGATYSSTDTWYGANQLIGDIRQGLPLFGYSSNFSPTTAQTSRPGGRGDYTKIAISFTRLQAIRGPFSLNIVAQGQWGFNPLLSAEQFSYGGPILGRGYDPAEILGDKGAAGSLELRYDRPVEHFYINTLQFYAFYDIGATWNYLYVGGVPIKQSATSTGLGVRFYATKYISGNLMWAQPLTKQVAAEELIGRGWRPRTWFSVVASFG